MREKQPETHLITTSNVSLIARQKWLLAAITFALAMAGYLATLARTVTLVDSGELILTSATLGVAHPPGFPLYTLLGYFFTKLPMGSVAARVSFMSALFAAIAATFVTLIVVELKMVLPAQRDKSAGNKKKSGVKEKEQPIVIPPLLLKVVEGLLPLGVGLSFAFSLTLWFYATVAEVYTLNIALLVAIIYLMLCWQRLAREKGIEQARASWLVPLAAGCYGLALGVHHVTILLTIPAFAALVWYTVGIRYFSQRMMIYNFAAVILGLLIYLYLPLAATHTTGFNWGNPQTLERFYWHISGKQYQVNLFSADAEQLKVQIGYFLKLIFYQFTPLGLAGILFGFWALWRHQRVLFLLLSLIIFFDVAYALNYDIAEDKDAYYLTTNLAAVLILGGGLKYLVEWVTKQEKWLVAALILLIISLPTLNFATHYFENNKRHYLIAQDLVENTLSTVSPGGLLLTLDWQMYSPYLYLRHIENFRRDATVVDVNLVRRSWYVEGYLMWEYPDMMRACEAEAKAFLADLRLFETDQPYDTARINTRFIALINAFITYHMQKQGAYITLPMEEGVAKNYNWVPQGLTMKLYPDNLFRPESPPALQLRGLIDGSVHLDEVAAGKVRELYATMIANRGKYLGLGGRYNEALEQFALALQLDEDIDRSYELMFRGDLYAAQNKFAEAMAAYQEGLQLNPKNTILAQRLQQMQGYRSQP